jgi:hypothetical protein
MATIDLTLLVKGGLSAKQKATVKKQLLARKKELATAMKAVDKGLRALAKNKK